MLEATTKAGQAYRQLRRAIVVGDIGADDPLDEVELMERFGTGRTPVREALKRLTLEQFILWPPRRTPYVRNLTTEDVQRLYESRMLMEKPAARLAATRITPAQLDDVRRLGEELRSSSESGDVYASIEADHALHIAVTRGSDNRFLTEAVDRLNCGSLRLWYVAHKRLGLQSVADQHQSIIDALHELCAELEAEP
ncbi:MAG: GntR family transcriptional regulator, partial [Actinomycetia bacterium]|nr:GntR family transcriptional regulator [Actinomycetes bacterium]